MDEIWEAIKKWLDDLTGKKGKETAALSKKAQKMWEKFSYDDLLKGKPNSKPCFLEGTLVWTKDGLVAIEQIKKGDYVWSQNQILGKKELKKVLETFTNVSEAHLEVTTSDHEILALTGQHLMWLPKKNIWEKAINLTTEDVFLNFDKQHRSIRAILKIEKNSSTFNLEIEDNHNYFVGQNKLLTHNAAKISKFASLEKIEVYFYRLMDFNDKTAYVGQRMQGVDKRFTQHNYNHKNFPKKKPWMDKVTGTNEIWVNGKKGPFKMTPFEAAVTEMYEMNVRGGTKKLGNKQNPISKKKFEQFKKTGNFNPCILYV